MTLTEKQRAVLQAIATAKKSVQAYLLYPIISPKGKYIERDRGPAGGGPSGREVAVHFYLNKEPMRRLVQREAIRDSRTDRIVSFGGYVLTSEGRKAVR